MPTYQYQCTSCGHQLEEFQSITEAPLVHCPACNKESLVRVIGGGAGLIFKGTGFYLTDYKKRGSSPSTGGQDSKAPKKDETPSKPAKPKPSPEQ